MPTPGSAPDRAGPQPATAQAARLTSVLFVLLAVLGGSGLVLYVAMWIIVPKEP
jgi:hypothetical protein